MSLSPCSLSLPPFSSPSLPFFFSLSVSLCLSPLSVSLCLSPLSPFSPLFRLSLCWIPPPFVQIDLLPMRTHTHPCTHNTHTQHTHTHPRTHTHTHTNTHRHTRTHTHTHTHT